MNDYAGQNAQQREANANTVGSGDPQKDKDYVRKKLEQHDKRAQARLTWEPNWQETLDHVIPRKADIQRFQSPGIKRGNELFDTTAIMSNILLSGLLHSMLTNPSIRFFELMMGDPALDSDEDTRAYLQDCADKMFSVMNNSNFQTEIHEVYLDLGAIGTSALYIGEDKDKIVHFSARSMKEIFAEENNLGMIDVVDRVFKWKLRQIVQEFGEESLTPKLLRFYKDGNNNDFEIVHITEPLSDEQYQRMNKTFRFGSCYLMKEDLVKLSEKNYHEFPYCIPRWTKTTGEVYGRGPGMDMLPDIKMVDRMMETTLKGAQKTVDPPLMVADDGVIGNVRLTPGGLTVVRPLSDVPIRPLITDARIDFGIQLIEGVRQQIKRGFFVDQIQLPQQDRMTAAEVNQRSEENLRLMGPVLGRQNFELLRPLIDRVFGIMSRRHIFKAVPEQLKGKKFDVRYSSLVARAQRMSEGQNLLKAVQAAAPFVNADPQAMDILDADEAVKYTFDIYGLPQKIMRKEPEIKKIRAGRAQAQADKAKQEAEAHQADVASKMAPGVAQLQQAQTQAQQAQTGQE